MSDWMTNMEEHRVLITTSGIGSRLGKLTDYTNKSLVRVGDKPTISHIIESYPDDTHFVITLGHYGSHVRDLLEIAYPSKHFTFVEVENFKGLNSSLLHSMKTARSELQCPFIFHACDSIIFDDIPNLSQNWIAGVNSEYSDQYRTFNIAPNSTLSQINEKGEITYDLAYPGLVGVKDFTVFWKCLDDTLKEVSVENVNGLSDCHVIQRMIDEHGTQFKVHQIKQWHDIGEPSSLAKARSSIKPTIDVLDKVRENIYVLEGSVIKFFYDPTFSLKRVRRASILGDLVPKIMGSKKNFFRYEYVKGNLFSKTVNPISMKKFLGWCQDNMWSKGNGKDISDECERFYFEKTIKRAKLHLGEKKDMSSKINGKVIPSINQLMSLVDKELMIDGISSIFHGDCILDNVIETGGSFTLIDWRQDFAGRIDVGDVYYDLAKLNHNLIFNHDLVNQKNYTVEYSEDDITCDILVSKNLLDCRDVLHQFIRDNKYDLKKVKILTAIIWINMSPLHGHPLDKFLYNFGRYNLQIALDDVEDVL